MIANYNDPRAPLDPHINNDAREGLTGTTPASIYKPLPERDQITIPPDGRPDEDQPQWRQDFPIDWPADHYVARREFVKFAVLTSGAFSVGQLWIGVQNWFRRRRGAPPKLRIAAASQLPVGCVQSFKYPDENEPCVLIHSAPGVFLAYSQKCTHLSCAVIPKPSDGCMHCPCHEGFFDLNTGRPTAGPPRRPLPRITLELRGDDIYATGIETTTV